MLDAPLWFEYHSDTGKVHITQPGYMEKGLDMDVTFYSHYNYTKGFIKLITNVETHLPNIKIVTRIINYPSGENQFNGRWELFSDVYLRRQYLAELYDLENIPKLLFLIISDKSCFKAKAVDLEPVSQIAANLDVLGVNYQRQPFDYQKANIKWMVNQEMRINNGWKVETYKLPSNNEYLYKYYIESIDTYLICDNNGKMINPESLEAAEFVPVGGILADDVGLGKTQSMLSLICERNQYAREHNQVVNPTLLILPRRLAKQWQEEINKIYPLKSKVIATISQFQRFTNGKDDIRNYQLIIISYNFLINKKYLIYKQEKLEVRALLRSEYLQKKKAYLEAIEHDDVSENEEKLDLEVLKQEWKHAKTKYVASKKALVLEDFPWERTILDEGHEYISDSKNTKISKSKYANIKIILFCIRTKYRWICSGTPYRNQRDCLEMIRYINKSNNYYRRIRAGNSRIWDCEHIYKELIQELFRKNTKQSVSSQVVIPAPHITTELLDQTQIERAIYDSALGNHQKMIQLCNHILVSEHHINILGNEPLTLTQIHTKMTEYYGKKVEKLTKRKDKLQTNISKKQVHIQKVKDESKLTEERRLKLMEYLQLLDSPDLMDGLDSYTSLEWCVKKCNNLGKHNVIDFLQQHTGGTEKVYLPFSHEQNTRMQAYNYEISTMQEKLVEVNADLAMNNSKYNIFNCLGEKIKETGNCPVCFEELESVTKAILPCGHFLCSNCVGQILNIGNSKCPMCRHPVTKESLEIVKPDEPEEKKEEEEDTINKWGTKPARLIQYLTEVLGASPDNRVIVFSQWDSMLKLIGKVLKEVEISHLFLSGSIHVINGRIRKFKIDNTIRVVLLSSDKAVSGLNLTEASHIVLLDTLNTDKASAKMIEEQAIGRAVRLGQTRNVEVKRLVMRNTIEEDYYQAYITN